ncbi:hypothetical protein D3C81_1894070 [compost metagenome]
MCAQGGVGHFRQQGHFPRCRQQGIGVIGNQPLAGDGGMDRVVEQQLGRVWRGAVETKERVFHTAIAAEAGTHQVLPRRQAELGWGGDGFLNQQRNIQGDDFSVDLRQLADQTLIEQGAELRGPGLLWRAVDSGSEAQVR